MATATEENDDVEPRSEIDLRPNGGIVVWLDGRKHRLRPPRLREFRRLRTSYQEAMDLLNEMAEEGRQADEELTSALEERRKSDETATLTPEERLRDRQLGRSITERTEVAALDWWLEVFEVLGTDPPDIEDLPPWLGEVESMANALKHWRTVPSRSGSL